MFSFILHGNTNVGLFLSFYIQQKCCNLFLTNAYKQLKQRNNTKMLIINSRSLRYIWLLLLVVFHCLQRYLGKAEQSQMLRIIRGVRFVSDDFLLPSSMCLNANSDPCRNYRAARNKSHGIIGCLCYCSTTQATFYEPKRQCVENQQVRTKSGKLRVLY